MPETSGATRYEQIQLQLRGAPARWLVTGCAGFIGSHLVEKLLALGQHVVGLDSFATGTRYNLEEVQARVREEAWSRFTLIEGDIREAGDCRESVNGATHVLHQAALGSVPRSLKDPIATHRTNVDGFLNMLVAARDEGVQSFIYASSSSVYGDSEELPKVEDRIGYPLSAYALTKRINEEYAAVFARCYGFHSIGLRYFNIFGPRQDPNGPYAAVIPKWINAMFNGEPVYINGDGETSRDFTYIDNAVQANLLAATAEGDALNRMYNVACGERTSLNELFEALAKPVNEQLGWAVPKARYQEFRAGDVRHSLADIGRIRRRLGYEVTLSSVEGLERTVEWFAAQADVARRLA